MNHLQQVSSNNNKLQYYCLKSGDSLYSFGGKLVPVDSLQLDAAGCIYFSIKGQFAQIKLPIYDL